MEKNLKETLFSNTQAIPPLHYTLLMAKAVGLNANESQIRRAYAEFKEEQKIKALRQKLSNEHAELLSANPELQKDLESSHSLESLQALDKKLKRRHRSKAAHARKLGFEDSFQLVLKALQGQGTLEWTAFIQALIKPDAEECNSEEKVLQMLGALLTEKILEDQNLEGKLRDAFLKEAVVRASKSERASEDSKFKSFFNFEAPFNKLMRPEQSHRFLTLRRGVSQGELLMSVDAPRVPLENIIQAYVAPVAARASLHTELLDWALKLASEVLQSQLIPNFQKEAFNLLRKNAEEEALPPIRRNLRRVLMSPGIGRQVVMGVSPSGKKTCRIAVVDREGNFKETALLHLFEDEKKSETEAVFLAFIEKHQVQAIAISDHIGAREIERFLHQLFRNIKLRLPICLLPAEASDDYASSKIGQEEFPEIETPNRKAIFIARQLQNPLGEFVKVKAKSLGVGQFLAEVHPESLNETLEEVLLDCIHEVGVDLNSASKVLLSKVAGLNEELADKIVQYRNEKGFYWDRDQILEVEGITPQIFEFCGPFLRVRDGKNPLDVSFAHPKYNKNVLDALKRLKIEKSDWGLKADLLLEDEKLVSQVGKELVQEFVTLIKNPPKDPRGDFKFIQFREDVKDIRDLKIGMVCPGRVSNVTSFGAFVDIGIQQDGLVHLSELGSTFVRDPFDVIHPGDLVTVKVLAVDPDKKQISFTMKNLSDFSEKNQEIDKRQKEVAARQAAEARQRPTHQARPERSEALPRGSKKGQNKRGPLAPPRKPSSRDALKDNPFAALAGLRDQLKR